MFKKICLMFYSMFFMIPSVYAADYIWPTDASRYLTSSFAEYRPGHFHAGIDVKTWGQEGYSVFAVRDGYISRIRVSPFGYGKVLYHTLDTGEVAVYAHLQGFSDAIESIVKREQKRAGEYRVNLYLGKLDVPVKQGEVIGFTGSTGIGYPHLHFEMRDSRNYPFNPMLRGYTVNDNIPPGIKSVAITPLDARSRVNGDVKPLLVQPRLIERGEYEITESLLLHGRIGIAIDCFDSANGVSNSYAAYILELYLDGERVFRAQYDEFSYDASGLIDLDRDFRLAERKLGLYQKLYIEPGNTLDFYEPADAGTGVLECRMAAAESSGKGKLILPGFHSVRIEVIDFNGNSSFVQGEFWIGNNHKIETEHYTDEQGRLVISGCSDEQSGTIANPHLFFTNDLGVTWRKKTSTFQGYPFVLERNATTIPQALKIISINEYGIASYPEYLLSMSTQHVEQDSLFVSIDEDFYDDFVRFEVNVKPPLVNPPVLTVQQNGAQTVTVDLIQHALNEYFGVYELIPHHDGLMRVDLATTDHAGRHSSRMKNMSLTTISPEEGGEIRSWDDVCTVIFKTNSVYRTLYGRIEEHPEIMTEGYDRVGIVYTLAPHDVPLKRSATVRLQYPVTDTLSEKLGVYGNVAGDNWSFIGSQRDHGSRTISAQLGGLRNVTLIRDTEPPMVTIYSPENGTSTTRTPLLKAYVKDELSGIASERSIEMMLDGVRLIAEYDPETDIIFHQCEEPLSVGRHELKVSSYDNMKNTNERLHVFYVK